LFDSTQDSDALPEIEKSNNEQGRPAGEHDFVTKDGRRVRYSICGMATKNDIKVGADKTLHLTAIPPALRNSR